MSKNLKMIIGGLAVLAFFGIAFGAYKLSPKKSQPPPQIPREQGCIKADTREEMSLSEAKEIALKSECIQEGELTGEFFCNDSTGTWWLDLEIEKEGCAPACVINVTTKKAEINWRCTGLIPGEEDEGRIFCQEPRPQICTMECIINPPYICGSDKKSYCSTCQACANPKVEWYVMEDEPCGGD